MVLGGGGQGEALDRSEPASWGGAGRTTREVTFQAWGVIGWCFARWGQVPMRPRGGQGDRWGGEKGSTFGVRGSRLPAQHPVPQTVRRVRTSSANTGVGSAHTSADVSVTHAKQGERGNGQGGGHAAARGG